MIGGLNLRRFAACASTSSSSPARFRGMLNGGLLGSIRSGWSSSPTASKPAKRHNYDPYPDRIVPLGERRPFAQRNKRRDDVLEPRLAPAVPSTQGGFVQAWLSSWDEPRAGIVPLRADVWDMPLRPDIVHRVVFWQRACMRWGGAKTKNRGEVSGGGRKPRPQKGTGKSRQGSIRAPHYRGGGRAFPKRQTSYKFFLPRKVQTLGLKVALSDKYRRGALVVLDDLAVETHQTSQLEVKMSALGIDLNKHRVMMLTAGDKDDPTLPDPSMTKVVRAAGNIFKVTAQTSEQCNVFDLVRHQLLLVDKASLAQLERRFDHLADNGHVYAEDAPKLPFEVVVRQGPGRERLSGGRKHYDPRIVPSESW